jgi:hypothetical protein
MQNKTSLRSFKMKNANKPISQGLCYTTSLNVPNIITMVFYNGGCTSSACIDVSPYIPVYPYIPDEVIDTQKIKIYVDESYFPGFDKFETITNFFFSKTKNTFGVTYNKQDSETTPGKKIFDVIVDDNAKLLNDKLKSIKGGTNDPQITYNESKQLFYILTSSSVIKESTS